MVATATAEPALVAALAPVTPPGTVRERLLALVHEQPGINKTDLCGRLEVAWGTVAYHIDILANAGLVDVEAEGREANLFPQGLAPAHRRLLRVLREPEARQVLDALKAVRESSLQELSRRIGVSRKIVRRHVSHLLAVGVLQDKGTRRPRYALADGRRSETRPMAPSWPSAPIETPLVAVA